MEIAIIGLGEVGGYYSLGLCEGGASVRAYDRHVGEPEREARFESLRQAGIRVYNQLQDALDGAELVLAVTNAKGALDTARAALPFLSPDMVYLELNSAVPSVKSEIAALLKGKVEIVDGTTMASVNLQRHKTPINLSGPKADEVSQILNGFGMNTHVVGNAVGQASAIKIFRSIFMKGIEAVLMECMQVSQRYGITEEILSSIEAFFAEKPMDDILRMLITTDAIHSLRRAEEMEAIDRILLDEGLENTMTAATIRKLHWISSLGLKEKFQNCVPSSIAPVLEEIDRYEKATKEVSI